MLLRLLLAAFILAALVALCFVLACAWLGDRIERLDSQGA